MPNEALVNTINELPDFLETLQSDNSIADELSNIDDLKLQLESTEPWDGIEESAIDDYRRQWLGLYTFNSNAIEGSTLTLPETELVLEGEFVPSDGPARFVFAARGIGDGMDYARQWVKEDRKITIDLIRDMHRITALDVQPVLRGSFRPYGYLARITGAQVKTADPLEIWSDLELLLDKMNHSKAHPVLQAAAFHVMFENIHPFADGNGRTGRQLLNLMLMESGYPPVTIKHDAGRQYGASLEQWQAHGNASPFLEILIGSIEHEQQEQLTIIQNLRAQLNMSTELSMNNSVDVENGKSR